MRQGRKLISVVIPAFNEELCIDELARRLQAISDRLSSQYEFEFVVVDNGSVDSTFPRLMAIREGDPRFKIIRFSRNFGIEGALTAALRAISGAAAIIICADLQDPPELIPNFIAQWEAGYQNVYGVITRRSDEGWLRQRLTAGFYWLINRLSQHPVPQNVSDFRLVDRKLYTVLNSMNERNRMLRTIWGWIGYKSIGVKYERPPRYGGKSTYHLFRALGFALHGIASSSVTPLMVIPLFGIALSAASFLVLISFAIRWFARGVPFGGFGTIVALILLLFGLLFLFLGIVTEYIGMIYEEVRGRPIFVTSETYGLLDAMRGDAAIPSAAAAAGEKKR